MKIFSNRIFLNFNDNKKNKYLFLILDEIEKFWHNDTQRRLLISKYINMVKLTDRIEFRAIKFNSLREFCETFGILEKQFKRNKMDSDILIAQNYKKDKKEKKLPIIVILDNLRSSFNVGSICRTCECFGIYKLFLCGSTPDGENKKVIKTSMGMSDIVNWQYFRTTQLAIKKAKQLGYEIVGIETISSSEDFFKQKYKGKIALVFGNEALGIDRQILNLCNRIVKISMRGKKESLNVSVSFGIVAHFVSKQINKQ